MRQGSSGRTARLRPHQRPAYRDLKDPLHTVGALLEAKSVHPGRSARNHLLFLAQTQGIPASRVEEVLALVGLQDVADKRVGGFSLGMSQRLGAAVAVAMLGAARRPPRPARGSNCMNASFMSLELHERGIHAVSSGAGGPVPR